MGMVVEELLDTCLDKRSMDNMTAVVVVMPAAKVGDGAGVAERRTARAARWAAEEAEEKEKEATAKAAETGPSLDREGYRLAGAGTSSH